MSDTSPPEVLAEPIAAAVGLDPLSFLPLPDPAASGFTIDQVWPRLGETETLDKSGQKPAQKPDWMLAITDRAQS